MALPSTRMEFRLALADSERGVELEHALVLARHPSETAEHVVLRVLAWCLWHTDGLELGPGLCDGDAADVLARDLTGRITLWVECGSTSWDKLRKVIRQKLSGAGARAVALFSDRRKLDALVAEIESEPKPPKERASLELALVDPELVRALASDERRHAWTVTVVPGHVYVDADGEMVDGFVERSRPQPEPSEGPGAHQR
jgi:uncharacterized protein YaeQ